MTTCRLLWDVTRRESCMWFYGVERLKYDCFVVHNWVESQSWDNTTPAHESSFGFTPKWLKLPFLQPRIACRTKEILSLYPNFIYFLMTGIDMWDDVTINSFSRLKLVHTSQNRNWIQSFKALALVLKVFPTMLAKAHILPPVLWRKV